MITNHLHLVQPIPFAIEFATRTQKDRQLEIQMHSLYFKGGMGSNTCINPPIQYVYVSDLPTSFSIACKKV